LSISAIKVSELEGHKRFDAEYYQPHYLELISALESANAQLLSEIATIQKRKFEPLSGQSFNYIEISEVNTETGRVNAIEISGEEAPSRAQYIVQTDDVIISSVRPNRNAVALITKNLAGFVCSSGFVVLRPKRVPAEFLFISLKTNYVRTLLDRQTTATMYPAVSETDLISTPIIMPDNKVIESVVQKVQSATQLQSDADSLYAEAERLLAAELGLDRLDLSESLFNVRRVSEVQQSRRADSEYYKRKYQNLLNFFDQKPSQTLEQIATFAGGATPLGADYLEEGIPFLRIQNVGDNQLILDDVAYIHEDIHESELKRSQLAPNDVLITITGRIGTSAVVTDELKKANINQHIVRMRLESKDINPFYLAAFLNSVGGRLQTEREAYGTTRDALPYYCLARIRVLTADKVLQDQVEQLVRKAAETKQDAKRLLAEAKSEVERLIEKA
jgi:restriction endonuclease S subunit